MLRAHRLALALFLAASVAASAKAQFPVAGQFNNQGFGGAGFNQAFGGGFGVNNQGFGGIGMNQGFGAGTRGGFTNQVGMNGPISYGYGAGPQTYNNLNGMGMLIDQTVFSQANRGALPTARRRNR